MIPTNGMGGYTPTPSPPTPHPHSSHTCLIYLLHICSHVCEWSVTYTHIWHKCSRICWHICIVYVTYMLTYITRVWWHICIVYVSYTFPWMSLIKPSLLLIFWLLCGFPISYMSHTCLIYILHICWHICEWSVTFMSTYMFLCHIYERSVWVTAPSVGMVSVNHSSRVDG